MRATVAKLFCRESFVFTAARAYIELFKVRIAMVIALSAVAGLIAGGVLPQPDTVALVALSVALAAMGAGALNHAFEADLDASMNRTRLRPLPSGRIAKGIHVWILGLGLSLSGLVLAAATCALLSGFFVFLGAFTYIVIYTIWLKRRTWLNVVIGGLAGSFAVLAGAAANESGIAPAAWQLALVLFFWSPSHFWNLAVACREDYRRGQVPMLPVLVSPPAAAKAIFASNLLLIASTVLPFASGQLGYLYLAGAIGASFWLIVPGVQLLLRPGGFEEGMAGFKGSMLHLGVLFSAIFIDRGIGGFIG